MNTCRNCRFWRILEAWGPEPGLTEWRSCALSETGEGRLNPDAGASKKLRLVAEAYYPAVLYTAPDYGCNQWQPRLDDQ